MGKYMRKSKTAGEVSLMEASHSQSSLGVRTRAKTLALKSLKKQSPSSTATAGEEDGGGRSYLQLRSRRLEKLSPIVFEGKRQRHLPKYSNLLSKGTVNVKQQSGRGSSSSRLRVKGSEDKKEEKEKGCLDGKKKIEEIFQGNEDVEKKKSNISAGSDLGVEEASFGENVLEFDGRERTTRESTPCSLIRNPDTIRTSGSSTRPTIASDANNRGENSMRRHIPTAHEMDEFFAGAEEQQQRQFVEKYNFDPVNDKPLPGRYEWEKLNRP